MTVLKFIIILLLFITAAGAQTNLPVIKSNSAVVTIKDGNVMKKDEWNLSPQNKPDIYTADLINGKAHKVTFITDLDQISFEVEEGRKYDFIIQWGDKACYIEIAGKKLVPAAVFDKKYQAAHKGKTFIEIPEVYELVNIAIAMTPTAITDQYLVYKKSDYYSRMRSWFDKYKDHPLITAFDAELKNKYFNYFYLKMDGYSYEFDKNNKIVQSKIYERTGFPDNRLNFLRPFLAQLQSFSDETNFREFFKQNRKTYDEEIAFYRDTANIAEMQVWLDKNFPNSHEYDTYKIIFSPLVAYNQSTTWFESNGFKELQPHVNFPYPQEIERYFKNSELSEKSKILFRSDIWVFTEINHGYINPEAEKYHDRILKATGNRARWTDDSKSAANYPGIANFEEYMNFGLISLHFVDYAPREDQDRMIEVVNTMMERRGFLQFAAFDEFLVDLYRSRKPNQTIAGLYPQIIEWFEKNN